MHKNMQRMVVLDYPEARKDPDKQAARSSEFVSFREMGCIEEVELASLLSSEKIVSNRWVLTLKTEEDGCCNCKARLVARDFEDMEKESFTGASSVASCALQRLVLHAYVERQYRVHRWDFKNALKQGRPVTRDPQPGLHYATE